MPEITHAFFRRSFPSVDPIPRSSLTQQGGREWRARGALQPRGGRAGEHAWRWRADGEECAPTAAQMHARALAHTVLARLEQMFQLLFDLGDYATTYRATRDAYLKAANELKLATGPYKAARDAYVAGTATYTKSLYE